MNFLLMTGAEPSAAGSLVSMVVIYGVLIFALWFFFMRPQSKERKKTQEMLATLEVGDVVVTTSGFYGVLIDVTDEDVIVEFGGNRNCRIPMEKSAIARVEKPGQSAPAETDKKKDK